MPVDKLPLTQADLHEQDASQSADQLVQSHHQVKATLTWQQKLLKGVASNLHYVTFLPLITISVLQDINIVAAAAACTSMVLLLILASFCCYRAGFVKVGSEQQLMSSGVSGRAVISIPCTTSTPHWPTMFSQCPPGYFYSIPCIAAQPWRLEVLHLHVTQQHLPS